MMRVPQSVALRVALRAFLSTDHLSDATGKTIAVTISKNGGAFGNPSAGATNATEIANGWYYVDLSTTDTGSTGPLIVRGTSSGVDTVEPPPFEVANAHHAGFDGIPNAVAGAVSGLPLGDASGRVDVSKWLGTAVSTPTVAGVPNVNAKTWNDLATVALPLVPTTAGRTLDVTAANKVNGVVLVDTVTTYTGNTPQTGDTFARIGVAGAGLTALGDARIANLDAAVSTRSLEASLQGLITTVGVAGAGLTAAASAVWAVATRLLTAGTNIVLAKGVGVTGFTDLSAAQVNAEADIAIADAALATASNLAVVASYLDTEIAAIKAKTDALPAAPAAVGDVPTAAAIATQVRTELATELARVDAAISTRATPAQVNTEADTAIADAALASAANLAVVAGYLDTEIAAIKAKTDLLPGAPAATGDVPTAAQNAAALLDLANGIETGLTLRQAQRLQTAALAGKVSGADVNAPVFRNVGDTKNRISATTTADGNRTAVTTDGT